MITERRIYERSFCLLLMCMLYLTGHVQERGRRGKGGGGREGEEGGGKDTQLTDRIRNGRILQGVVQNGRKRMLSAIWREEDYI